MYGCESLTIKKVECWRIDTVECCVGEDSWDSLDCKEIKPVNHKGNQYWIFIGRTDIEAEAPILWQPDAKSQLTGKDPDAGKDWGQEKEVTEYERVGWHHRVNRHEFEQTLGDSEGQGSLMCYSPWSHREWDTTDRLNNNKEYQMLKTSVKPGFSYTPCEFSWSSWDIFLENFAKSLFSLFHHFLKLCDRITIIFSQRIPTPLSNWVTS